MRYVCEFAGENDEFLIRDVADEFDELEDCLLSGIEHLGPLLRCYAIGHDEILPILGLVRRDALTRAANA